MSKVTILIAFLVFACFQSALAQKSITGKVTKSKDGLGLSGVTVAVKGASGGTVTDANGAFTLSIPSNAKRLSFSFIGMKTEEVEIGTKTSFNISLTEANTNLDSVMVVGYGTAKRKDVTGSISSVPGDDIRQLATQRVDQALQGRATGVSVQNTDGSPGGPTLIRIRGHNSINGDNSALIVVDGLQDADLNTLNPSDIESVEILKDASATAIYGSRGANGVILITTKLGTTVKPVITSSYSIGNQSIAKKIAIMNAGDFTTWANTIRMADNGNGNVPVPIFSNAQIADYYKKGGTDWQDEIFKNATLQNANIAISGSTEKVKYLVSTNYLDQQGITMKSKYARLSLRANLTAKITNWVDFGLNYSFTREKTNAPSFRATPADNIAFTGQGIGNAIYMAPTDPVFNPDGSYAVPVTGYAGGGYWNPVASIVGENVDNPTSKNNVMVYLNFKLLPGLTLKIIGGGNFATIINKDYYNSLTYTGMQLNGFGDYEQTNTEKWQNTNILTYDKNFGAHHITFTGVAEQIQYISQGSTMNGQNFLIDPLGFNNFGGAATLAVTSFHQEHAQISYMGRVNYSLHDKYLATVSYRADGSSVFGANHKWGYFPSGSVAWRVSQENFLKDSRLVSNLKLRASYGITGNQAIPPYSSLSALGTGWNPIVGDASYNYAFNGVSNTLGAGFLRLANPNLKWETTRQTDLGVDISLFKGRLTSTIDVYRKTTDNLLMASPLPEYVGIGSVLSNVGTVQNQGLEIQVGGDPLVGKVKWNTSFNISFNQNKVLYLGPNTPYITYWSPEVGAATDKDFRRVMVGKPLGLMYGQKYLGMWGTAQAAEAAKYGQLPGQPHWLDVNNDGMIDANDKVDIGHAFPKFTCGWTNTISYKKVELSFLFIGSYGNQLFNQTRVVRESQWGGNSPVLMHPWTPTNQGSNVAAVYDGAFLQTQTQLVNTVNMGSHPDGNSRWMEDASYIKLKTLTLAYSFDQKALRPIGFKTAKVYLSGTNLLTFTKYTGFDPEGAADPTSDLKIGVDGALYPQSKIITFGADFTF